MRLARLLEFGSLATLSKIRNNAIGVAKHTVSVHKLSCTNAVRGATSAANETIHLTFGSNRGIAEHMMAGVVSEHVIIFKIALVIRSYGATLVHVIVINLL